MAISRLNLVSINFDKYRYNEVLLKLFSHDDFHPELASKFIDSVTGLSVYNQDNLYSLFLTFDLHIHILLFGQNFFRLSVVDGNCTVLP